MLLLCLFFTSTLVAQNTIVQGRVTDVKTGEGIAFAAVAFNGTTMGTTTDFNGYYIINANKPVDSLRCVFVGYNPQSKKVVRNKEQTIDFELLPTSYNIGEVVIRPGENPAEVILKKIIKHKEDNDKSKYDTYQYETYNKLQFDLNNFTDKISKRKTLKQLSFIFDNVDTSETGKAYLPIFMTETVSDFYSRKNPADKKEYVKASKVSGVKNASVSQFLGDMYQNIDIYENTLLLFDKGFISPISNSGILFYKYFLTDSVYLDGRWCYKIDFVPRLKQDLTFTGNLWVADTSFAIKKIQFQINKDANINFIKDFFVQQEYTLVDGKYWMRSYEKVVADFNPLKTGTMGLYGRKTTYYRNIKVDKPVEAKNLKGAANIVVSDSAMYADENYWREIRPDSLTKAEKNIYKMVDTIKTLPVYRHTSDLIYGIVTGYMIAGPLEIGPVYSLYSFNNLEGNRFRFGMRTSNNFSKRIEFSGYGAYGMRDKEWKYFGGFRYMIAKAPRQVIGGSYRHDIELLGLSNTSTIQLNVLASIGRRRPLDQLLLTTNATVYYEREWFSGFLNKITLSRKDWMPGLFQFNRVNPDNSLTAVRSFTTTEATLLTYFAFDEKYVNGEFDRTSLGTRYPRLSLYATFGFKNLLGGSFQYQQLKLQIDDRLRFNPLGYLDYSIEAGKTFGALPYPLLNIQTGNETYGYSSYYFNMTNFNEFACDQYVRLFATHHFDGLFLNKIPLLRKLKWREVATFKGVIGSLSAKNRNGVYQLPAGMYDLAGRPYMEVGVGIENIFKVLRIDALWRLTHLNHPDIPKFGIRAAIQIGL